jgi:hypothetical protein
LLPSTFALWNKPLQSKSIGIMSVEINLFARQPRSPGQRTEVIDELSLSAGLDFRSFELSIARRA